MKEIINSFYVMKSTGSFLEYYLHIGELDNHADTFQ